MDDFTCDPRRGAFSLDLFGWDKTRDYAYKCVQRGVRGGCSGTVDNLLIDRIVILDCHRRKRNVSMGWVDVKKAYDSIDHGWLEEMMLMHRFPSWLCRAIQNLSRSWSTRIVTTTRKGREVSDIIRFRRGLPQGDALCPRLFTVCLNPIAWKISATEGYRLSNPIDAKVTDLLYIDDLKIFAALELRLNCDEVGKDGYGRCGFAMEP